MRSQSDFGVPAPGWINLDLIWVAALAVTDLFLML
jgi:hypothetical protein